MPAGSSRSRPTVSQPWPYSAASRIDRGPLAAITNGTLGCCRQPGSVRALLVAKYSPRWSTWSVVSSRSSRPVNSASRSASSRSVGSEPPRIVASIPPPEPIPQTNRPPEMSSSASRSRVSGSGCRKFGVVTKVPKRARSVTVAAAARVGMVPCQGESGSPRQLRWSYVQRWSKPSDSACRQIGAASDQVYVGRMQMPKRMPRSLGPTDRQSV